MSFDLGRLKGAAFPDVTPAAHETQLGQPRRLHALADSKIMDSLPDVAFDRVIRIASQALGVPVGLISFVDDERQFFAAQEGLEARGVTDRETPLSHSLCQYVVSADRPLAVSDARTHPLLTDNGAVTDMGVVAYLGVPVHAPTGEPLGSFCAIDDKPHVWSARDLQLLQDLRETVETELRLRQALRERDMVAREMDHRVKNLFSMLGGMINMTARQSADAGEMAQKLEGRLGALAMAHDLIRPRAGDDTPGTAMSHDLGGMIATILAPHHAAGDGRVTLSGPDVTVGPSALTNLSLALHEMATNAAKYGALGPEGGRINVDWSVAGADLVIDWREEGGPVIDAPPSHRSFGSRLISSAIAGNLGGEVEVDWRSGGVVYRLRAPMAALGSGT